MALQNDDELEMTTEKTRRRLDRLNIKLPFLQAELSGHHILAALVILCFATPIVAAMYFHHVEQEKQFVSWIQARNEITGANTKRLIKLEEFIERNEATQEGIIYMLSLSQEDRAKLQLSKPAKIRELERK